MTTLDKMSKKQRKKINALKRVRVFFNMGTRTMKDNKHLSRARQKQKTRQDNAEYEKE